MSEPRLTLRWNPFAVSDHNEWRLPRIAFHATHVLMGVAALLLGRAVGAPLVLIIVAAAAIAIYSKFVWLDWRRTSGTFFHPWVSYTLNPSDFVSDLGLTMLGVLLPPPLIFACVYYLLSVFNDP